MPMVIKFVTVGNPNRYFSSSSSAANVALAKIKGDTVKRKTCGGQNFVSFEEARKYAHSLGFRKKVEWSNYAHSSAGRRPKLIPARPDVVYRKRGFIDYADFLGYALDKDAMTPRGNISWYCDSRFERSHFLDLIGLTQQPDLDFLMPQRASQVGFIYRVREENEMSQLHTCQQNYNSGIDSDVSYSDQYYHKSAAMPAATSTFQNQSDLESNFHLRGKNVNDAFGPRSVSELKQPMWLGGVIEAGGAQEERHRRISVLDLDDEGNLNKQLYFNYFRRLPGVTNGRETVHFIQTADFAKNREKAIAFGNLVANQLREWYKIIPNR